MLSLEVIQGPDAGRVFPLPDHEPQLIGRSSEALPITDNTVSRRHAELTPDPDQGAWYVNDLESANGTFVNGHKIESRTLLQLGDQIKCGSSLFVLVGAVTGRPTQSLELIDEGTLDVTIEHAARPRDVTVAPGGARVVDPLRIIYELTALTASSFDQRALLERVMDLVFEAFGPDRGFILLGAEPEGPMDAAVIRHRVKPTKQSVGDGRIPISRTIIAHVRQRGEGILSTNAMSDTRFASGDSVRDYGIRSAMCVPIISAGRITGVIHIDSQLANVTFNERQLHLLNAVGQHTGLALHSLDLITSRVQTERLAAMGQTVASLSHSIKNILQGLRGGADAVGLALNKDDLSLAREGWPILSRNLDRIFNLTLNMLAFSRESALDVELVDLHDLIDEAKSLIERQADAKGVVIVVDPDEHMPPVPADTAGLHQAIMNLLINAVEAVPAKQGKVTVRTHYDLPNGVVSVSVIDNGPGMNESQRRAASVPFATTKGQRGTGLGLAVSQKIVEQHGGTLAIESVVKEGTTVTLNLPTDQPDLDLSDTQLPHGTEGADPNEPF